MADIPENKKEIKPLVQIDKSKVRKSTGRQFLDSFITHDFSIVTDYLFNDILIPTLKNTIVDTICSAVTMIFKGTPQSGSRSYNGWNNNFSRTDYGSIFRTSDTGVFKREEPKTIYDYRMNSRYSSMAYMDIPFKTRADAEEILFQLNDIIDEYKRVSVAQFYELVGYDYGMNYQCHNWGWTDLSNVIVTWSRSVDSWIIALPKAVPIK